jgi:hypothetical protein
MPIISRVRSHIDIVVREAANMEQFLRDQCLKELQASLRSRDAMVVRHTDMSAVHGPRSEQGMHGPSLDVSKIL